MARYTYRTFGPSLVATALLLAILTLLTPLTAHAEIRVDISKQVDKATAAVGDTLFYTIEATNLNDFPVPAVVVLDDLPAFVTYLSETATGSPEYDTSLKRVLWFLSQMQAGETVSYTFGVKIQPGIALNAVIDNLARIAAGDVLLGDHALTTVTDTTVYAPFLSINENSQPRICLPTRYPQLLDYDYQQRQCPRYRRYDCRHNAEPRCAAWWRRDDRCQLLIPRDRQNCGVACRRDPRNDLPNCALLGSRRLAGPGLGTD